MVSIATFAKQNNLSRELSSDSVRLGERMVQLRECNVGPLLTRLGSQADTAAAITVSCTA